MMSVPSAVILTLIAFVGGLFIGHVTARRDGTAGGDEVAMADGDHEGAGGGGPTIDDDVERVRVDVTDDMPQRGPDDALVTIVMFSDFQCPFCGRVEPTLTRIREQYGDRVRIVWRNQPLPFHDNAMPAAEAALEAYAQGGDAKFWQLHDVMMEHQTALTRADLETYAQQVGLDMTRFRAALDNHTHQAAVQADSAAGTRAGANGTPSFFINGRTLRGAQPYPAFKALIDEELQKAEALVKSGTSKTEVYAKLTENGLTKAAAPAPQKAAAPAGRRKVDYAKDDPAEGGSMPKVTIVEFSDFQCPFCSRVVPTMKQVKDTYKDDVKIVFKQNPLPFHKDAPLAAQAALAAHEQGKFWQMHDKLFENQKALDRASLEKYAAELGLNMSKFKAALDANKFQARIDDDIKLASSVGAGGTPAFFINGKLLSGAQPFDAFKTQIDDEIKKADELLKKGVKKDQLYAELMKEANNAPPPAAGNDEDSKPANVAIGTSAVKGDPKAPVTIVEFSDFECPFCGRVGPTIKQVEDAYKGKVKITFKHQPLPFHSSAMLAAQAAEAAKEQGKFWEMHDKMFANQKALSRDNLIGYAKEIGLDTSKFEKALDSDKVKQQIAADQAEASKAGANGTPTFFINGKRVVGAQPFEQFKAAIDEALKTPNKG